MATVDPFEEMKNDDIGKESSAGLSVPGLKGSGNLISTILCVGDFVCRFRNLEIAPEIPFHEGGTLSESVQ